MDTWTFTMNYADTGRRASRFETNNRATAYDFARRLSIEKGRAITIRGHTYGWYNDPNTYVETFVNGMSVNEVARKQTSANTKRKPNNISGKFRK